MSKSDSSYSNILHHPKDFNENQRKTNDDEDFWAKWIQKISKSDLPTKT